MATSLSLFSQYPVLDSNGDPISGAKLYTYEAQTTTPLTTYTDAAGTIAATNPLVADANGRIPTHHLTVGSKIKFVLTDANDVQIWTLDNFDPPAGGSIGNEAASTPEDYGAVGDGVTDDTTAMTNLFAAGGRIRARAGSTYRITSTVEGVANSDVDLTAGEVYCDFTEDVGFEFTGTESAQLNPAAAFEKGAVFIQLTSLTPSGGSQIAVGDWLRIGSNRVFDQGRTLSPRGEAAYVESVDTLTNTIKLGAPLEDSYQSDRIARVSINNGGTGYAATDVITFSGGGASTEAEFTVAAVDDTGAILSGSITNYGAGYTGIPTGFSGGSGSGADITATIEAHFVTVLGLLENISFKARMRGKETGATPRGNNCLGAVFTRCLAPMVSDSRFEKFDNRAVGFVDCVLFRGSDSHVEDTEPTGTGYGIAYADASNGGVISGITGNKVRHLTTGVTSSNASGIPSNIAISNCVSYNSAEAVVASLDVTATSIDTTNDYIVVSGGHDLVGPDRVKIVSTGDLPGGIEADRAYWGRENSTTEWALYPTREDALYLTNKVNITTAGSGTITIRAAPGGDAFDTHAGCRKVVYTDCHSVGASGIGFIAEGPDTRFVNCTATGGETHGFQLANYADEESRQSLIGCEASDNGGDGFRVLFGNTGYNGTAFTMIGCEAYRNAATGAFVTGGATGAKYESVTVSSASLLDNRGTAGAIFIRDSNGVDLNGGHYKTTVASAHPVRLRDCDNFVVQGARMTLPTSATGSGILIEASSAGSSDTGILDANIVKSPSGTGRGVTLDSDARNVRISRGNDFSEPGTDINAGTGTGHIIEYGILEGSGAVSGVSVGAGDTADETVTVTGASLGDFVEASSFSVTLPADLTYSAFVSAANTVTLRYSNPTGGAITGPSGTAYVRVKKRY